MNIFLIILFLIINFFFTSSEMAFVASNKLLVAVRARKKKSYKILLNIVKKPEIYLYTILVGTNLSLVFLTTIAEKTFLNKTNMENSFIFSICLSFVILIVAEIIPKSLTKEHAENIASIYAPMIRFFYFVLYPIIFISTFLSEIIFKIWKLRNNELIIPKLSKSDLMFLVNDGVKNKNVHEENIIEGIFNFNETYAHDIMIPRTDIVSIDKNSNFEQIKKMLFDNERIYTRLPVYNKEEDNIIGIVNINDIIINRNEKIENIMDNNPLYAPENASLENLLVEMKKHNKHMIIIINEYGGLSGIITIEDIIEEFLGEISDEYDTDEIYDNDENKIIINGDMRIDEIRDVFKIKIPESNYYETIAGFVLYKLGKIPEEGIEIKYKNINIKILKMIGNAIIKIEIIRS